MSETTGPTPDSPPHRRRPRYSGKNPRRFADKYKERDPARHADTVARVLASGKTPAGTHRPILVPEILEVLAPAPGEVAVDATLGFGGHAREILARLRPGGRLIGIDVDPVELPRTETRLRELGFGAEELVVRRTNFAGLPAVLNELGIPGVDLVLADLGVSSMQIDDPARGFSVKEEGPLDMRMNPGRGVTAAGLIRCSSPARLAGLFREHSDEPRADVLAAALAGRELETTGALVRAVREALPGVGPDEVGLTARRVFQALRIEVNGELDALGTFLRFLPGFLRPGGRVAILTFHSGEDRRVKNAFAEGRRAGLFEAVSDEVIRPGPEERRSNPRSTPAKLRWARRSRA